VQKKQEPKKQPAPFVEQQKQEQRKQEMEKLVPKEQFAPSEQPKPPEPLAAYMLG
jgi:hypothetical protein